MGQRDRHGNRLIMMYSHATVPFLLTRLINFARIQVISKNKLYRWFIIRLTDLSDNIILTFSATFSSIFGRAVAFEVFHSLFTPAVLTGIFATICSKKGRKDNEL